MERYLSARMKLRRTCRMLDMKYQQSELDFCAKTLAKVIKFLCVILPTVYVWGGLLYVGIFSLIFGENNHQMVKFLQKKNIFKNMMQKKKTSDHNFTCASIVKKNEKKQNKNKKKKQKKQETVLVRSPTNFSENNVQLLIPEIVVHTVHEYK